MNLVSEPNHYDILEIPTDASPSEITQAFRKKALEWHPDKNPNNLDEATSRFIDIVEAYRVLSSKDSKLQYDTGVSSQTRSDS
ncbi:MAG: J domain-containing protein, partial [Dehalococcoidia bacterium]